MPVDENKDPQVDGTEKTSTESLTPETTPTIEEQVNPGAAADGSIAVTETQSVIKPTPGAPAEVVDEALEEASDSLEEEEEEEKAPTAKVIRKESSKVSVALTEEVKEEAVEIEEADTSGATGSAHDDFAWDAIARIDNRYSDAERTAMEKEYEASMTNIQEAEIMSAKVSAIIDGDVVLDLNYKSDGLLPLSEFRDQDIEVGTTVEVYVEQQEDEKGQLVLSRRKAKLLRAWDRIRDSYQNGTVINGKVISKTKGGLIADCGGLETFLPGSQIDIKPIIDYDAYVGKTMEFKVVKINETIKNAVVSHKALIESDLAEQREAIIASLERGQVLEGIVKNITDFGAFLDLGGVDGLLYITDISWGRINHPSDVLELNQKVNVAVLDFDENKKRISLGLKQLQPHPWEVLDETITEGSTVEGRVVNIEDYGAFLEIMPGVEGLVHVSEVTWSNQPINAREYFTVGETRDAKVVTIDRDDRKMSLSIKQLQQDPWDTININFPEGSKHSGKVKNLTPYGVFVELNDGIGGMIHISDLSWTKRFGHPSEFVKVGEDIDVVVLEVDDRDRKMSLGHKQLEENPWDSFESVFPEGSYHEATVLRKDDRGAIVQMPYGLEAYAPIKLMRKEDGSIAEVDETLTVKVIEFDRDQKKLMVSHSRYVNDIRREAKDTVVRERREEQQYTRKAVKQTNSSNERSTLGDLSAFEQLREQLNNDGDEPTEDDK
ncbi:Polyribonucleotide nucleotidyltransferase [Neolewinella maritima]|uniref:Polyribonucleotide nucleotidyltransferase n=1 Tax=Neolewinella maritima TaxID=1383882 RepID=A0ABM9B3W4_9BACT|nr:30S ribosomal protein S1 [Neolewinella maritima]CAH1001593.1 Polyribonucleotide nucleotidyltransferase [Neolewinella maritima]